MATTTDNLGLTLPTGTDNITRAILNGNFEIIDEAAATLRTNPVVSGDITVNKINNAIGSFSNGRKANTTTGQGSIAYGYDTEANKGGSIAIGHQATASGDYAVAVGNGAVASGQYSKSMGGSTIADGEYSYAIGKNNAVFDTSTVPDWTANTHYYPYDMVKYNGTIYTCVTENTDSSFSAAKWWGNLSKFIEMVGNKLSSNISNRSNARALDWAGNEYLMGDLFVLCNPDSTGGLKVLTESDLEIATVAETQAMIADYWGGE